MIWIYSDQINIMWLYIITSCMSTVTMATELVSDDGSGEVTCTEYGHVYTPGERMPHTSSCDKPCHCSTNGHRECTRVVCEFPACFDAVQNAKEECCPRCPNGANCKLDGYVLLQGESITQSLGKRCSSICTCIYGGQEPTCVLECDDVPPLDLLDLPISPATLSPWKPKRKRKHRPRKGKQFSLV